MGFILKLLGGSIGPYIAGALGAAFLGLSVAVWLLSGQLGSAHKALASERALFATEHQSFLAEQAHAAALANARTSDHHDAVKDASDTGKACEGRIVKARVTAQAIDALLNKAPDHANDPAEPELLTAGELRTATGR